MILVHRVNTVFEKYPYKLYRLLRSGKQKNTPPRGKSEQGGNKKLEVN